VTNQANTVNFTENLRFTDVTVNGSPVI
jgi:hypothetical protein